MSKRLVSALAAIAVFTVPSLMAGDIIHDAEYYVLEAQHGERWAEQDKELQAKLAALRDKHGTPPNVIHLMFKAAYPDKGQGRDFPLKNIENARPETIKASQPRIDPSKVPFDPREAIMQVPEWDNLDRGWGVPQ